MNAAKLDSAQSIGACTPPDGATEKMASGAHTTDLDAWVTDSQVLDQTPNAPAPAVPDPQPQILEAAKATTTALTTIPDSPDAHFCQAQPQGPISAEQTAIIQVAPSPISADQLAEICNAAKAAEDISRTQEPNSCCKKTCQLLKKIGGYIWDLDDVILVLKGQLARASSPAVTGSCTIGLCSLVALMSVYGTYSEAQLAKKVKEDLSGPLGRTQWISHLSKSCVAAAAAVGLLGFMATGICSFMPPLNQTTVKQVEAGIGDYYFNYLVNSLLILSRIVHFCMLCMSCGTQSLHTKTKSIIQSLDIALVLQLSVVSYILKDSIDDSLPLAIICAGVFLVTIVIESLMEERIDENYNPDLSSTLREAFLPTTAPDAAS